MLRDKAYDEFPDKLSAHAITPNELTRVIDFLEQVELETEQELGVRRGNQELRMLAFLMRNHLTGRQTTQTTLIQASGLTYGTALRVLEDLVDRGTVIKRPRTKTGRSFSLHPSPDHIKQWKVLSRRIKGIVGGVVGWRKQNKVVDDYYFGSSYMCASVIQAPSALPEPLPVSKVRMLLHADPTFLAMSSVKRQFEELIGTNIEIKTHSIDRLYREIYNNSQLNRSKYDIVACDITWVGEMASRKVILPNNDFFGDDEFSLNDFHPTSTSCATFNDQYYGVPIHTAPELFLYRRDLFEEAGLQVPTTTGSVLKAVKALHNPNKGMSGIAWNAASGTPLGHTFCMVMAAFGQPIINLRVGEGSFHSDQLNRDDFRPQFLSNAAFETANYLLELMDYSPKNIFSMSWYERAKCYANGDCAMAYCYSLLASMFLNDKDSPTYGVTNFLPHPHGPKGTPIAPMGGYVLAIPSNIETNRIEAALQAMRFFTSAESIKQYVLNGSTSSPRMSVGSDPEVYDVCQLVSQVDQMERTGVLQGWPRPPIPELPEIVNIIGEEIFGILKRDTTIKSALSAVQNRCDALMRANGRY